MLGWADGPDQDSLFELKAEPETPSRIEFRGSESRWEALVYLAFGAGFTWYVATSFDGWRALCMSVALGAVFLILAVHKAFGDLDRSVHLAFDESGLSTPHIFRRTIPWSAIRRYDFDRGEARLNLRVWIDTPHLYEPLKDGPLALRTAAKLGTRIPLRPTTADLDSVEAAFRQFAPHLRRG